MTKETISSILHLAGETLSDPTKRCTGTLAQDEKGRPVKSTSKQACRWCLTGALGKAMHELNVNNPADQNAVYFASKDLIGLEHKMSAPVFWDQNEHLHDLIAGRLKKAE